MPPLLRDSHVHVEASERLNRVAANNVVLDDFDMGDLDADAQKYAAVWVSCVNDLIAGGAAAADVRFNPVAWSARRGVSFALQKDVLKRLRVVLQTRCAFDLQLVVSLKREHESAAWEEACRFVEEGSEIGVAGVDVSRSYQISATAPAPVPSPMPVFAGSICRSLTAAGYFVAVHCGWFDTIDDVWQAIDELGATRIGHGVPIGTDDRLLRRICADAVLIEVCPTAAEVIGKIALADHPFRHWLRRGVKVAVGSDHPLELGTSIGREAARIRDASQTAVERVPIG